MLKWHWWIIGSLPGPALRLWLRRHAHQNCVNSTQVAGALPRTLGANSIMQLSAFYSEQVCLTWFTRNPAPWLAGSQVMTQPTWRPVFPNLAHGGEIYSHCAKKLDFILYTKLLDMDSMDIYIVENYRDLVFEIYHYKLTKCWNSALAKTLCPK